MLYRIEGGVGGRCLKTAIGSKKGVLGGSYNPKREARDKLYGTTEIMRLRYRDE